jgi:hypothetical protein
LVDSKLKRKSADSSKSRHNILTAWILGSSFEGNKHAHTQEKNRQ